MPEVSSWGDLAALVIIVGAIMGALAWGVRLDMRSLEHDRRLTKLEAKECEKK